MPQALTYPGVYIEEKSSGVHTITGVATSITLFIGWAPKGSTDNAEHIASFADFQRKFGGLNANSHLGYAVKQFYDNGGSEAYVVRIAGTGAGGAKPATQTMGGLTVTATSPGLWGNQLKIVPKTTGTNFRLDVIDTGPGGTDNNLVESFVNLSMTATDARFVKSVVNNNSAYITVDTTSATIPPAAKQLANGLDGPVLRANDAAFTAALTALFAVGGIVDRLDLFNILCVPGLTDKATIDALQGFAQKRRAFLLVDPAQNATAATTGASGVANPANMATGSNAMNSALYFPWITAPDPLQSGALTAYPPSGFMAGVLARTDSNRGVWKAPAGTEASLNGAVGFAIDLGESDVGLLNPRGVNCLRTLRVYGNVAWGARTLFGDDDRGSEWKYIPVRRMALFLEESLYRGTQWVVFEPNDEPLWASIRLNIGAFMQGLFRQGAFQGKTPREAYFVKCDSETTTQADINLGVVNILVGFAPLKPAEFVVITIQQIAGDIPT
jgi:phage tail sheath protein FI